MDLTDFSLTKRFNNFFQKIHFLEDQTNMMMVEKELPPMTDYSIDISIISAYPGRASRLRSYTPVGV